MMLLDYLIPYQRFFPDIRTGRKIRHAMPTLLRQSEYSRLAGYEDINDAER